MKIKEIFENVSKTVKVKPLKIKNLYGGGSLAGGFQQDSNGKYTSVFSEFTDKDNNLECRAEIENNRKKWTSKPDLIPQTINISENELADMFERQVIKTMMEHLENHIRTEDPMGDKTLDLIRKTRMDEKKIDRDMAKADIQNQIKPFMDNIRFLFNQTSKQHSVNENVSVGGTSSGSIATVSSPIGGVIKRNPDSFFGATMSSEEFPNTPKEYLKKKKNAK